MNSVKIQPVGFNDLGEAEVLFKAQLREHDVQATASGLRDALHAIVTNPHLGFMLFATTDDHPVGVAYVAALLSLEHEGVIGWLEELYVLPEHRNGGVGSALICEAVARARALGWKGVELELMAGHERAAHIYTRHGFMALSRDRFCHIFGGDKK